MSTADLLIEWAAPLLSLLSPRLLSSPSVSEPLPPVVDCALSELESDELDDCIELDGDELDEFDGFEPDELDGFDDDDFELDDFDDELLLCERDFVCDLEWPRDPLWCAAAPPPPLCFS